MSPITPLPAGGLYAITCEAQTGDALADAVRDALEGGARAIQYRDKSGDASRRLADVRRLLELCRAASVPLIVNDDVALAETVGADGVHLGRDDPDPARIRARLGARVIVGVSCYDEPTRARAAVDAGASYVAFGSVYPSLTKPDAVRASLELLGQMDRELGLPIVAIGGITVENAAATLAAGASWLAVVSGVFGTSDVRAAARAYARIHESHDRGAP